MRYTHLQHLRTLADFAEIRAFGTRRECGFFYMNLKVFPERIPATRRLGVIASKRIGNAVRRNRAKRLLREVFRHHQDALPESCDVLLIARPYLIRASYGQLGGKFLESIRPKEGWPS